VSAGEVGECPAGVIGSRERVEVVGPVDEAGQCVRGEFGAERDHELVEGDLGRGGLDEAVVGLDVEHLGGVHLDPEAAQTSAVAPDLLGAACPGENPQVGGRERVGRFPVDEHHAVVVTEAATEAAGRDQPAGAGTEDGGGLGCLGPSSPVADGMRPVAARRSRPCRPIRSMRRAHRATSAVPTW
jgi:hypothetical protein